MDIAFSSSIKKFLAMGSLFVKQYNSGVLWVLAVDLGFKKTGLAIGQTVTQTAQPIGVLSLPILELTASCFGSYIKEWRVGAIIFGQPMLSDGSAHPLDSHLKRLVNECKEIYQLPVFTINEYLSSHEANRRKPKEKLIDSVAATVIAEDWLVENFQ